MKNIIWYVFAGTKGGITRIGMVESLRQTPQNANQLAQSTQLDYKTVRHHLNVLEKNNILTVVAKKKYGSMYFISQAFESNIAIFEEIKDKLGSNLGKD